MNALIHLLLLMITITACNDVSQLITSPGTSVKVINDSISSMEEGNNSSISDTIRHVDTTYINGERVTAYCTSNYFFYVLNGKGDTIFAAPDLFPDFEFADFNNDGFDDIRIYYITNVPDIQDLVLYDSSTERFRIVERFANYPSPESIKGTKYYYSYHRSGCADMNWDSDLFYIEEFKTVRIGNISGRECGNSGIKDGLYISKVKDGKESLILKLPIKTIKMYKDYKWGFIKSYWTKNYKKFLQE